MNPSAVGGWCKTGCRLQMIKGISGVFAIGAHCASGMHVGEKPLGKLLLSTYQSKFLPKKFFFSWRVFIAETAIFPVFFKRKPKSRQDPYFIRPIIFLDFFSRILKI